MLPIRNASDSKSLIATAPAKLIISGEHSVLYGQPALAMSVNRYTTTTTTWSANSKIHFNLLDLAYAKSYTLQTLQNLAKNLHEDYNSFLAGKKSINSVIKRPFELLQYSVSRMLEVLNIKLPSGVDISVGSNIPIGCGMGSSAAAVVSTVSSLTKLLDCNWQRDEQLAFCREVENLQHGRSSGLDLHLVTYGGCVRFENGLIQTRPAPNMSFTIVNTGQPESSTGTCVTQVAPVFAADAGLATEFAAVTNQIDTALAANNLSEFKDGIRANHRLLCRIGVVPAKVANFISAIEATGGAAKICGGGAVSGNNAGVVLIIAERDVQDVISNHGYEIQTIQVDTNGIKIT